MNGRPLDASQLARPVTRSRVQPKLAKGHALDLGLLQGPAVRTYFAEITSVKSPARAAIAWNVGVAWALRSSWLMASSGMYCGSQLSSEALLLQVDLAPELHGLAPRLSSAGQQ